MKYILMLLISFAFGQVGQLDTELLEHGDFIEAYRQEGDILIPNELDGVIFYPQFETHWLDKPITPRMIIDYAKDCRNDSTWVYSDIWGSYEINQRYYIYREDDERAYLRRKFDIIGFSEWLERNKNENRYKRKN